MSVLLISHPACGGHDAGPGQPECPARLRVVLATLKGLGLTPVEAQAASLEAIGRVHPGNYAARLLALEPPAGELVVLDSDTNMGHGSGEAALRAAGAAMDGVDAVLGGRATYAFAAVRPPGHHAEPGRPMGFCLFNSVAVAALHARAAWGVRRVAVLDFDVHHGNGTEAMFRDDPELFYGSTHQSPCYPGTGPRSETGVAGNICNRPLAPGAGSVPFRAAWEEILSEMARFGPELVIASAGFDAHAADPLASLMLETEDFRWMARRLAEASGGRLVSVLEGGYDLPALGESVAAYVGALMNEGAAGG